MNVNKVRVKMLRPFMLAGGAAAAPGTIVEIDALQAFDLAPSQGELVDPERARVLINEAAKAATETAARRCGPIPRGSQLPGEAPRAWSTIPHDVSGYRPHVH